MSKFYISYPINSSLNKLPLSLYDGSHTYGLYVLSGSYVKTMLCRRVNRVLGISTVKAVKDYGGNSALMRTVTRLIGKYTQGEQA